MDNPEKKVTRNTFLKGAAVAGAAIALKSVFSPALRAFGKSTGGRPIESG